MADGKTKIWDLNGKKRFFEFSVICNIFLLLMLVYYCCIQVFELRSTFFLDLRTGGDTLI